MFSKQDFQFQDGSIWLNAASEGPLPRCAAQALQEAVTWKSSPYLLTFEKFAAVPAELKKSIGRLLNVPHRDVILGNSASYGLHILANGIRWDKGDEVLLMQNDFPTNILPWLALEKKGVIVRQISPADRILTPEELQRNISSRTKIVCLSHVHTFSGLTLDIPAMAGICHERGAKLVLNVSQSAGTMPLDISVLSVDAVVCAGYKWLCGPYGTGFCWIRPDFRDGLDYNQAYWIASMSDEELQKEDVLAAKDAAGARKFDVFGTANFFNFVPFRASLDYFLDIGSDRVHQHIQSWIEEFLKGLDGRHYDLISSRSSENRSALVVISHKDPSLNGKIHRHLAGNNVYTALWKNNIRIAPHVYNNSQDGQKLLQLLRAF